jgi:undecaprenyl-diphosphatase
MDTKAVNLDLYRGMQQIVLELQFYFFCFLKGAKLWVKLIFIDWAIFICYTRIYLGVHYPADLIGGAIIGIVAAFIIYRLYLILDKKLFIEEVPSTN